MMERMKQMKMYMITVAVLLLLVFCNEELSPPTPPEIISITTEDISTTAQRFRMGWGKLPLPIKAKVAVIDHGGHAVGLSAMQLDALGIHSGVVRLRHGNNFTNAKVWNAFGTNYVADPESIRITDSVAATLGCSVHDEIEFVEATARNFPLKR